MWSVQRNNKTNCFLGLSKTSTSLSSSSSHHLISYWTCRERWYSLTFYGLMKKCFLRRERKGPSVMAAGSFPGFQLIPGQLWESPRSQLTGIQNELVRLNKPVHQAASHWEECNPPITTPSPSLCFSVLTLVSQKRHQRKHSSAGPARPAGGEGGFGLYVGGRGSLFFFVFCMTSGNNTFFLYWSCFAGVHNLSWLTGS